MTGIGTLEQSGGRWRLRFTRELAHPPEKVWRAISEHEHLLAWFPHVITGDWTVGGTLTFTDPLGRRPAFEGEVLASFRPAAGVQLGNGRDPAGGRRAGTAAARSSCWTPWTSGARPPATAPAGTSAWTSSPPTSTAAPRRGSPAARGPTSTPATSPPSAPRQPPSASRPATTRGPPTARPARDSRAPPAGRPMGGTSFQYCSPGKLEPLPRPSGVIRGRCRSARSSRRGGALRLRLGARTYSSVAHRW